MKKTVVVAAALVVLGGFGFAGNLQAKGYHEGHHHPAGVNQRFHRHDRRTNAAMRQRNPNAATPATPAVPAKPGTPGTPATPAVPAKPATPSDKSAN